MIYFFKMKRWFSMKNHEYFKYTKYVIGEIFIVIIGILVAIQLNNLNEERKEREKFNQVLLDVQGELKDNIIELRIIMSFHADKDKFFQELFIDSVTVHSYTFPLDMILQKFQNPSSKLNQSIDKLVQINNLSLEQDSIVDYLKIVRNFHWGENSLDEMNDMAKSCHEAIKNLDWYRKWFMKRLGNEEAWDFLKNDPDFMFLLYEFFQSSSNYLAYINFRETQAFDAFEKINEYFDKKEIEYIDSSIFDYDPHKFEEYTGKYKVKWYSDKTFIPYDSVVVSIENDKLMYNAYLVKRGVRGEFIPTDIPFSSTGNRFRVNDQNLWPWGIFHAFKNNEGEDEIRFSAGPKSTIRLIKVD